MATCGNAGADSLITLWRGSLLPLGCAAAPEKSGSATHSSASKLARHTVCLCQRFQSVSETSPKSPLFPRKPRFY
ncbi:MAG TPA: hypothetical protein DIW86_17660 [Pseudomonas sp.]|nr:hypothetical protein [Pseudomonas sp.]